MPLTSSVVSAAACPKGKNEAILWDDEVKGFGLRVTARGHRTFIVTYRAGRTQRKVVLGTPTELTLAQARRAAGDVRAKARIGVDVAAERRAARSVGTANFGAILTDFLERRGRELRPRTLDEYRRQLEVYALSLHRVPADAVTRSDIARLLDQVQDKHGPGARNRTFAALHSACVWAVRRGLLESNPASSIPKAAESGARSRVLSDQELAGVWQATGEMGRTGALIQLLILTAARRQEIGALRWAEVHDLDGDFTDWPAEDAELATEKLDALLKLDPKAASLWLGADSADDRVQSLSEVDFHLAARAIRQGWSFADLVLLLRRNRARHADPKGHRRDYICRTIENAYLALERTSTLAGSFGALDLRLLERACNELELHEVVALLVLACGANVRTLETAWSVNAVEQRTGVSRQRCQKAIERLTEGRFIFKLRDGARPRYRLATTDQPLQVWLPTELVGLNAENVSLVERLRRTGDVDLLYALAGAYAELDLAGDGGVSRRHIFGAFEHEVCGERDGFVVHGFSRKGWVIAEDSWAARIGPVGIQTLIELGAFEVATMLFEHDGLDCEIIHPAGDRRSDWIEDRLGSAAHEAGLALLGADKRAPVEAVGLRLVPMRRAARNLRPPALRKVIRPRLLLPNERTTEWLVDLCAKGEEMVTEYAGVVTRYESQATVDALVGIGPRDEIEGMLAAQMLACHHGAMECYRRAMLPDQPFQGRQMNLSLAGKATRTYTGLVEALNRHRGKGQQKVTVEHVHVHAGGQAVVGNVEQPGGGDGRRSEEQPHARQLAHAPERALRCDDPARDPVPGGRDAERSVSDARR